MDSTKSKPRLLFFQYKYDERLPAFLLAHKREHVKCLSEFFDVVALSEDGDYRQFCDTYKPDLVLFESGVNHPSCQKLRIANTRAHEEIPKLGLHHADSFCNARAGFLSDMDHWGIETFFAIATAAPEHTPEIADRMFVWPVFVDPEIYHDYGGWKSIPVLFTGNTIQCYPWRRKIVPIVSEHYPSLICPHPGYGPRSRPVRTLVGEDYARTLNASWFVPSCGTVAKEAVRKHFEIPASRACLIAERAPALEAAGFVDMKNCIFAEEGDVLDKMGYLFKNLDELRAITDAGHDLVHSRHTLKQRDQILQWYTLQNTLKPGQRIIQPNPFEPMTVISESSVAQPYYLRADGAHLQLIRQGDDKLWAGQYEEAERFYFRANGYINWMPEPKLKLALCSLFRGNAKKALSWIEAPIHFILCDYKAIDPDPVEWAYFLVTLVCLGKVDEAARQAGEFPWLRHPELDRARWAVRLLDEGAFTPPPAVDPSVGYRASMHHLPARTTKEWIDDLCIMLNACGQRDQSDVIARLADSQSEASGSGSEERISQSIVKNSTGRVQCEMDRSPNVRTLNFFAGRKRQQQRKLKWKAWFSNSLHRLEINHGYFLPYRLSESRNDELFKAIRELASEGEIRTALVIGGTPGKYNTEAFLAGLLENRNEPSIFCINASSPRLFGRPKKISNHPRVKWYESARQSPRDFSDELARTVERIRAENRIESFDLLLIDGCGLNRELAIDNALGEQLHGARVLILDDLNGYLNYKIYDALIRDPSYFLSAHNPELRNGYAIFKKLPAAIASA